VITPALVAFALLALQEPYRLPPKSVVDLIDAPVPPLVRVSPDAGWMLRVERDPLPTIADVSRRFLRLAGVRVDPVSNGPVRTTTQRAIQLVEIPSLRATTVPIAEGSRIGWVAWSHTSRRFAWTRVADAGTELWVAAVNEPTKPVRVTDRLNEMLMGPSWMPDGESLLAAVVPDGRGPEPPEPSVPKGPTIEATSGVTSPLRTFQDLLQSPHDEALFEHYATAQLAVFTLADGKRTLVGKPAIVDDAEPAPDGRHLRVTTIHRPFSYFMPSGMFPSAIEVWDLAGAVKYRVADLPLAENIPIEGVRTGPRSIAWRPDKGATLVWAEALDGGDPRKKVAPRDRWMTIDEPYEEPPREWFRTEHRATGCQWTEVPGEALVADYDRDKRWTRTQLVFVDDASSAPVVLESRSVRDRYGDPGRPLTRVSKTGSALVARDRDSIFRSGEGATPNGPRPFLDQQTVKPLRFEPNVGKLPTTRVWQCEADRYESVVQLTATSPRIRVITRHETPTSPPNYRLRSLPQGPTDPAFVALTTDLDPQPQIRDITKRLVKYKRADGVDLSATLYLPAGWKEGTRLPLLVWAYPLEFNDAATAGQVSANPNAFTRISGLSQLAMLTQGYAVMDDATMPVVGDPETMNDTFLEQIVASAKAAIDEAVREGVAERDQVAVGGHSYGAFMTANLLAHSDLFRAGVARSGAYNRTLTPFGFQSERRTLWEAPKSYVELSPFFSADRIRAPLLLIHGEDDSNPGTFPIQSERLFQAIKGTGGTARLVMLPKENHGYSARESVLHVQAETIEWLDAHVKRAP